MIKTWPGTHTSTMPGREVSKIERELARTAAPMPTPNAEVKSSNSFFRSIPGRHVSAEARSSGAAERLRPRKHAADDLNGRDGQDGARATLHRREQSRRDTLRDSLVDEREFRRDRSRAKPARLRDGKAASPERLLTLDRSDGRHVGAD